MGRLIACALIGASDTSAAGFNDREFRSSAATERIRCGFFDGGGESVGLVLQSGLVGPSPPWL
jgi:hypothetical protein